MSELNVIRGCLALMVLLNLIMWYKGYRTKKFKYNFKQSMNMLALFVYIIGSMYILVGVAILLKPINIWASEMANTQTNEMGKFFFLSYPLAVLIAGIIMVYWVARKCVNGWFKYNSLEKQWQDEEKEKFKAKMPKIIQKILFSRVSKKIETIYEVD